MVSAPHLLADTVATITAGSAGARATRVATDDASVNARPPAAVARARNLGWPVASAVASKLTGALAGALARRSANR